MKTQEQQKYYYADRWWNWEELSQQLEQYEHAIDFNSENRINLAMSLAEGPSVLDLGSHIGTYANFLAGKGYKVTAADVDPHALEIGKRRYPNDNLEFVQVEGTEFEFADNSFDCVLLLEVLEHTWHPRGLVKEIHRVLKPGGCLVLSVPNAASYHTFARSILLNLPKYFRKMESWPEFAYDQRDHFYYWDPFTMYRLLNKQGFRYVEHRFTDNFRLINFLAKIIRPLRKISTCFIIKVRKEEPADD